MDLVGVITDGTGVLIDKTCLVHQEAHTTNLCWESANDSYFFRRP